MIEVRNLTKRYGANHALSNLNFSVEEGDILGFLGPNGAGKTTTMNIITGYLSATSGTVSVDGFDVLENPYDVKSRIGYLPEQPPLYLDMTVKEYLYFMYELKRVRLPREEHLKEICELVRLGDVYGRPIKNLSKGYRQRVGLAQALLGNPPVLILDEPTVGLDPKQIIEIRNLIKQLGKKHTVILSSHILSEVQAVCNRIIVIHKGTIVADGTSESLSREIVSDRRLTVRVEGPRDKVYRVLKELPGIQRAEEAGEKEPGVYEFVLEAKPGADIRRGLFNRLSEKNWPIMGLKTAELNLEDIFLSLTENSEAKEDNNYAGNL